MNFNLEKTIAILSATPDTVDGLVRSFGDEASDPENWQPFDVVGHLIHGEKTDWIPRPRTILEQGENRTFVPFDRFAEFEDSKGKSVVELLSEFARLRALNLDILREWNLTGEQLDLRGMHPELGEVTLRQLIASWVVHDLTHIRQIGSAMAKLYTDEVGPWREYLSILNDV